MSRPPSPRQFVFAAATVHSSGRRTPGEALRLAEVTIWRLSADDRTLARIEAASALLQPGRKGVERSSITRLEFEFEL